MNQAREKQDAGRGGNGFGRRALRWLDERLGLDSLHYEVPPHANTISYTLGGITLGGIIVLFVTGLYMTQFYHPHPAEARESVIYLITRVSFGEFVRGVHWWTANLVVITAALHLLRVFITASYKRPREVNWTIGVVMFTLLVALFFTGTVLKWDQEAYEALQHNQEIGELLGRVGVFFTSDFTASTPLLTRLSFVHTAILPGTLTLLLFAHLFLVKHHGISPLASGRERFDSAAYDAEAQGEPRSYFDQHFRQLLGYGMLLAALAVLLAVAIPATLGAAVTPGLEVTKPPWLFWWLYAFENWWGVRALLWAAVAVPVGLLAVPIVDRTPFRHILNRKWLLGLGIVVVLGWIALTVYVGVTPTEAHIEVEG